MVIPLMNGAEVLGFVGRWQDALEETREVEAFEPLPPNRHWEVVGVIYVALGRYAEAAELLRFMAHDSVQVRPCGAPRAKATINRELAVLSHLFNKALEWRWLKALPAKIKRC